MDSVGFDPMLLASALSAGCCCVGAFLVVLVAASIAMRPRPPEHAQVAGIPPAPRRGVQATASLTKLEDAHHEEQRRRRPGPPNG